MNSGILFICKLLRDISRESYDNEKLLIMLKAHTSSERQRRVTDEADTEAKAKQNRGRDDAEQRRNRDE